MPATPTSIIHGPRAKMPAKKWVRLRRLQVDVVLSLRLPRRSLLSQAQRLDPSPLPKHLRRHVHTSQAASRAPSAALSRNPANSVVAVLAVLGSRTADTPV